MQHVARLEQYQQVSRLTATRGRLKEPGRPRRGREGSGEEMRTGGMPRDTKIIAGFTQNAAVTGFLQVLILLAEVLQLCWSQLWFLAVSLVVES